jgi:hypothetical protein
MVGILGRVLRVDLAAFEPRVEIPHFVESTAANLAAPNVSGAL